jgi:hypothetical protein
MTYDERTMLWITATYVFFDALPKVESFTARIWNWLN